VVDEWRSVRARRRREEAVAALEPPDQAAPSGQDDSLALLLMCCHPVLPVPSQLALTLRAVGLMAGYFGGVLAGRTPGSRLAAGTTRPGCSPSRWPWPPRGLGQARTPF
jgi:hypothetical protein